MLCEGAAGSVKRKLIHAPQDFITTYQTFNTGLVNLDPRYFTPTCSPVCRNTTHGLT